MDVDELKEGVRAGRIDAERLLELVVMLQRELQQTREELKRARQEIEQKRLGGPPPEQPSEAYSMEAEERRQQKRRKRRRKSKRQRRGRRASAAKLAMAGRIEAVFPAGVDPSDCVLSHVRPVWRLEGGRAVLVAYHVYRGPRNQYGKIPGALGRSEFGIEIILTVAYLVHTVGLSFDKVCQLLNFFQELSVRKSQIDAMLHRLAKEWEDEFEVLCTLLAHSLVVYTDETRWSINSVWAFLSEKVRVLFFGVHKDAATLEQILNPATFAGIVISDDAAIYANFTQCQKCWAHLLRKAIKLTLLDPNNPDYRLFTDELLGIYRRACQLARDGRLSDAGRARKVTELETAIFNLCGDIWGAELPPLDGPDDDLRRLCNELMRLMIERQLFTFVTAPAVATPTGATQAVSGTNNEAERSLRGAAMARKTGRTNKTVNGARRQTIIVSVLESLRQHLANFKLHTVIAEINRWAAVGQSCFSQLLTQLGITFPKESLLNRLLPIPDG